MSCISPKLDYSFLKKKELKYIHNQMVYSKTSVLFMVQKSNP